MIIVIVMIIIYRSNVVRPDTSRCIFLLDTHHAASSPPPLTIWTGAWFSIRFRYINARHAIRPLPCEPPMRVQASRDPVCGPPDQRTGHDYSYQSSARTEVRERLFCHIPRMFSHINGLAGHVSGCSANGVRQHKPPSSGTRQGSY